MTQASDQANRHKTARYGTISRMAKRRNGRSGNSRRSIVIGVALAAVTVALVGGGLAYDNHRTASASGTTSTWTPEPEQPAYPVAILGDSYSAAVGATSEGSGYARQTARAMCWRADVSAEGGTGYTNAGQPEENESAFPDRVASLLSTTPRVVIVQGSTNDTSAPEDVLRSAASRTYAEIRGAAPDARVIALGPTAIPSGDLPALQRTANILRSAADGQGVTFIDPIAEQWLDNADHYNADGVHPSQAGHTEYAARLSADLDALGFEHGTRCG